MSDKLGFPVFDADNHLYETGDALTKYLPANRRGVIDFVEVHGRTKIMVNGQISNYIPNPTFDQVGRPGAQEEYFKSGNPEGKSYREIIGRGIDCPPAFRGADHVIFGSDFPHVEGLADPLSWAEELHGLPDEELRLVMGGNMMQLLGISA